MQTNYQREPVALQRYEPGFSMVELVIVIGIISILSTLSLGYIPDALADARDSERRSDVSTIARFFEKTYREQSSASYSTYPSVESFSNDIASLSSGGLNNALIAPRQTALSTIVASSNGDLSSVVNVNMYIYQPLLNNGSLCQQHTASTPCSRYKLWYQLESGSNPVQVLESRFQQ